MSATDRVTVVFHTTADSTYEALPEERLIRRVGGTAPPTPRQGEDGTWRRYDRITQFDDGLLIVWETDDLFGLVTWTAPVTTCEEVTS